MFQYESAGAIMYNNVVNSEITLSSCFPRGKYNLKYKMYKPSVKMSMQISIFYKGEQLSWLFVCIPGRNRSFKLGQLLKERICSCRSKFFPLKFALNFERMQILNSQSCFPLKVSPVVLNFMFGETLRPDFTLKLVTIRISIRNTQILHCDYNVCYGR